MEPNEGAEQQPAPPPSAQVTGSYVGVFSVDYYQDTTYWDSTYVDFSNGNFFNPYNTSHLPLGGDGTYVFDSDSVEFKQYVAWPAIYDWNLYLSGKYEYSLNSGHLVFHKTVSNNIYKYDLYF